MTNLIIGLLISMVFSAFFSGMEIAFVSSNRLRVEMDRDKHGLAQRALDVFYRQPSHFISTMLVGNNIALVVYGILFAKIFDATLFAPLSDGAFALPAFLCYVVLWPVSRFSTFLSRGLLRLIGAKIPKETEGKEFTKVDLDYLVQSSIDNAKNDAEIEDEVELFHNAIDFADTKVRDCMVPRTEIDAIDVEDCTIEQLKNKFIESGHSKIIVYRGDIDHIIGYIHSSEMFKHVTSISKHIQQMPYVPETMAARKLMHIFLQQKKSLGVVIDEFGGTSGIVSLEDIVEEITGDIEDEHDNQKYVAKQLSDGDYMLSARLEIEKVNELFDLDLPESDDYMTVGGLILHEYQSFPKLNEVVSVGRFQFKIVKNTMTKIELVRLKVTE